MAEVIDTSDSDEEAAAAEEEEEAAEAAPNATGRASSGLSTARSLSTSRGSGEKGS